MDKHRLTSGYVKLHRQILGWEWYGDLATKALFLHLLLTANIAESRWMGVEIPRGARVASIATLASELNLTSNKIRTALGHLEMTGEITRTKHPKFTVIAVVCWDEYQTKSQGKSQANDTQEHKPITGLPQQNKNNKEVKEIKEITPAAPDPPYMGGRSPEEYERWRWQ